ncbi:MAG: hypothetical protein CVV49_16000 [Spirochaetae bacterium HGW-Spirochaetae-5]|nr:MAG: hypothetical protein CVV49_16000 [Spirochaetae bacterium HGW-Spirochaetae-5]
MKLKKFFPIILSLSVVSCSSFTILKDQISINDLLSTKETIDKSTNPAEALLLKNNLSEKILILKDITVKDIIVSTNVDYDFCVLADLQSEKGPIECYIYTKNIKRISQLKKGVSVINVKGEFRRYFSMLDDYYTKIEITNSIITIAKE